MNLEERLQQKKSLKISKRKTLDKMTDWYFTPKSFERWGSGRIYEFLGMHYFKKLCAENYRKLVKKEFGSHRAYFKNNYLIWDFSKEGLKKFDY